MKWTAIIILLIGLFACNNQVDNKTTQKTETAHIDSTYIDSNEINGSGGQSYKEFHDCNFDKIISDKKTPKLAKDIYLDNKWNLNNDKEALALLDSLKAKNKSIRPFYFKVVTKTYKKSDGYFSEGLGLAGKEYVENNEEEFATNFDNSTCFTGDDLKTWAKIVVLEFQICDENIETSKKEHLIYGYCRNLTSKSENYSDQHKQTINKFTKYLKDEWGEFLKHI